MATTYRIYPPIGMARIGNSPEFFFGPESPGSLGTEIQQDGTEAPSKSHKDANHRVKRQAARFQIYEFTDGVPEGRPFVPPDGVTITWRVELANLKDAVQRPGGPPAQPMRPVIAQGRENRAIRANDEISGGGASSSPLVGKYLANLPSEKDVTLGELKTDAAQRLIVLGGSGRSESPEGKPIGNEMGGGGFYNNPGWFDDVSDGPITAEITFPDRTESVKPAWVIVGPPDFAPDSHCVVTLYDVLVELAEDEDFRMLAPFQRLATDTFFTQDIQPIIERSRALRWVNGLAAWDQISDDMRNLGDNTNAQKPFRQAQEALLRRVEHFLIGLSRFRLMKWQRTRLEKWGEGSFERAPLPTAPAVPDVVTLTRSVLDATVGQGFFPGIEAGRILLDKDLYSQPFDFRLSHSIAKAGWLTALMALPWQADFIECHGRWWPSQRPDLARIANGSTPRWARPLDEDEDHRKMVEHAMKFGMIFPAGGTPGAPPVEVGRDDQGIN